MVVLTIIVVPLVLRGRVLVEAGETVDHAVGVEDGVLQGLRPSIPPRNGRDDLCGNQRAVPTAIALTRAHSCSDLIFAQVEAAGARNSKGRPWIANWTLLWKICKKSHVG